MSGFTTAACAFLLLQVFLTSAKSIQKPPSYRSNSKCFKASEVFPKGHICSALFPQVEDITLPNPRSGTNESKWIEEALAEFDQFYRGFAIDLDTRNGQFCSDEIFTLLCFFYFPICYVPQPPMNTKENITIFPCFNVCQRVTAADGACTRQLLHAQEHVESVKKTGWAKHFKNCDAVYPFGPIKNSPVFKNSTCLETKHGLTLPTAKVHKEINTCSEIGKLFIKNKDNVFNNWLSLTGATKGSTCSIRPSVSKRLFERNDYNYCKCCYITFNLT